MELELTDRWTVLYRPMQGAATGSPLPSDSPLQPLPQLMFEGPEPNHPFILGEFASGGRWGITQGHLRPLTGKDTAIKIVHAEDFELQGVISADGLGGWFILVGWDGENGYCISNVEMKTKQSGSPWGFFELVNGKTARDTHMELHRYSCKGPQQLVLSVVDNKLNLQMNKETIAKDLALHRYKGGDVIVGTYNTQYGPKTLQIRSLRVRGR